MTEERHWLERGLFSPDSGTVTVIVREHPESKEAVAYTGWQHVFRLQLGDSVAVTQRDPDGSVSTRFFNVIDGGFVEERKAMHGEMAEYRDAYINSEETK